MKKVICLLLAASAVITFAGCPVETPDETLSADNAITEFGFKDVSEVTATINGTAIEITVPYGTDLTSLVATFTSTGFEVAVDGSLQVSGETANNFTSPVTYTVTAEDGTGYDFIVTVTVDLNNSKAITSFSFLDSDNYDLSSDIIGEVTENRIILKVPCETVITSLIAIFTTSGENVQVDGTLQTSGDSANDFTAGVVYTVTAEDGGTQIYNVDVLETVNRTQLDTLIDSASDLSRLDVSEITDMGQLFENTTTGSDISGWDVSNVTDMHGMFYGALTFNQYIGDWDVGSVTDMTGMFQSAQTFNQDISGWDVSSVASWTQFAYQSALTNAHIPPRFR